MVDHAHSSGMPGGTSASSQGEEGWSYGQLTVVTKNSSWRVLMDSLALWGDEIMLLSVAGPETSIKAINACLVSKVSVRFDSEVQIRKGRSLENPGWERCCPSMVRHPTGYETYKSRLGYNMWHLLALSKAEGFMPCLSETALHQTLRSPRYSTPYLRAWI